MVDLHSPTTPLEQMLEWQDPKSADYQKHAEHLRECLKTLKRAKGAAATWARGEFQAELDRVEARIATAADKRKALETARAEARKALAKIREFEARPKATDVDAELRAIAEKNILSRACVAARAAFVAAAEASALPPLRRHTAAFAQACFETDALVSTGQRSPMRDYVPGHGHSTADLVKAQGNTATPEVARYYAVAEQDHARDPDAVELFAARWMLVARRLGLPHPDLEAA